MDYNNYGNSADIRIQFRLNGNTDNLVSLKLFISKAASEVSEEDIASSETYVSLDIKPEYDFQLEPRISDMDGDAITENISYSFHLLLTSSDEEDVRTLGELSIADEIVVTTPNLDRNTTIGEDIIIGEDNTVYVCNAGDNPGTIFKIENDQQVSVLTNEVEGSWQVNFDNNGNLLVGGENQYLVLLDNGETSILNSLKGSSTFDNDGYMYVVDYVSGGSTIFRVSPGNEIEEWLTDPRLDGPVNIHYDDIRDRFYVTNWDAGSILIIDKQKSITTLIETEHSFGHSTFREDRFFVTSYFGHVVLEISLDGEIVNTIGSFVDGNSDGKANEASFSLPNGIGITPDGTALYVSCFGGPIRKIIL